MSEEMAMFWFGMSALIALWGLSQYNPRPRPTFHAFNNMLAFQKGLMDGLQTTKEKEGIS